MVWVRMGCLRLGFYYDEFESCWLLKLYDKTKINFKNPGWATSYEKLK